MKLCHDHHFLGDMIGNSGRTGSDEMLTLCHIVSCQITKPALLLYCDRVPMVVTGKIQVYGFAV